MLNLRFENTSAINIESLVFKHSILLILFILFSFTSIFAQSFSSLSSSKHKYVSPFYRFNNKINLYLHNDRHLNSSFFNHIDNIKLEKACPPVFKNEERQLIDGTYWRTNTEVNNTRLLTVFGGILAVDLIAYIYQRDVWYVEPTTNFHTVEFAKDMRSWQFMDKIGHFADAYFVSDLSSKLFRWSGLSGNSSVWYGALTGFLWTLQIELSDGFMQGWGWSWGDMIFNTLGSGFFVLQQYFYDELGGLHPKISWHKSDAWKEGRYYRKITAPIEDYEGITFWLSINPHHYFPDSWKQSYPDWLAPLGLAVGYSSKEVASNIRGGYNEVFIGLDIDLRKIPLWRRF